MNKRCLRVEKRKWNGRNCVIWVKPLKLDFGRSKTRAVGLEVLVICLDQLREVFGPKNAS